MTTPRVSVIVAAHNAEALLERAVTSVLTQTVADTEVIIIDDASTDRTASIAEDLEQRDPRVRHLRLATNSGPGTARAAGLEAAIGEWIAVLDADDVMRPDRLEILLREADCHSADVVADNLTLVDPATLTQSGIAFPIGAEDRLIVDAQTFMRNSVPGGRVNLGWMQPMMCASWLRRHEITWRDIRHAEDMLLMMELLLSGARVLLLGVPAYHYTTRVSRSTGGASSYSRTIRDPHEQIKAVKVLLEEKSRQLPSMTRERLRNMETEIIVTNHVLNFLAAIRERRLHNAAGHLLRAFAYPAAFSRCLRARYGRNANTIR